MSSPRIGYIDRQASEVLNQSKNESLLVQPLGVIILLSLHIPLALLMFHSPEIATLHALFILGIGVIICLLGEKVENVFCVVAYIMGSEVIWRATHAAIFWEFGKYAIVFILCLAMVRFRNLKSSDKRPLIYFVLLLPSLFLLPTFDRQIISFNLSGPLSLAVATMFFSKVALVKKDIVRILNFILAPLIGLAFLALSNILTAESIVFANTSMTATSADFGPNQVSSILGLGSLAAFYCIFLVDQSKFIKVLMIALSLWLLVQSALTFSRGGLWTTILSIAIGTLFIARDRRSRVALIFSISIILLLAYFVIIPALNTYSAGMLLKRFSDPSLTGRDLIMKADWLAFIQNPIFGVGPGQSKAYHALFFRYSNAHTEYTRMIAEHGSLGLLGLLLIVWIVVGRVFSKQDPLTKAFFISCTAWALFYMFHAGMRLVAPAIIFGIASATIQWNKD